MSTFMKKNPLSGRAALLSLLAALYVPVSLANGEHGGHPQPAEKTVTEAKAAGQNKPQKTVAPDGKAMDHGAMNPEAMNHGAMTHGAVNHESMTDMQGSEGKTGASHDN
jgi:uncharacterized protein involved in copper resistance